MFFVHFFLPALGSVVALRLGHALLQECDGACRGRCGAGRAAAAAAGGFDPGQREQRGSCGGGRHGDLDHVVTLDEADQSLEALQRSLGLSLLAQEMLLQIHAFLWNKHSIALFASTITMLKTSKQNPFKP